MVTCKTFTFVFSNSFDRKLRNNESGLLTLKNREGNCAFERACGPDRPSSHPARLSQNRDDLLLYSVSSSQGVTFDAGSLLLFAVGTCRRHDGVHGSARFKALRRARRPAMTDHANSLGPRPASSARRFVGGPA